MSLNSEFHQNATIFASKVHCAGATSTASVLANPLTVVDIKARTLMGATLLRSGDRTSFGSALRTRRRAEPDAVVKIGTYGPCAEFIKTAPIGSARMRRFYFNLVHHDEVEPIGHPVADRGQAIAVAQRLAIDIAEKRQDCLGKGYSVSIVDDAGIEIHRESVDSAEKSG